MPDACARLSEPLVRGLSPRVPGARGIEVVAKADATGGHEARPRQACEAVATGSTRQPDLPRAAAERFDAAPDERKVIPLSPCQGQMPSARSPTTSCSSSPRDRNHVAGFWHRPRLRDIAEGGTPGAVSRATAPTDRDPDPGLRYLCATCEKRWSRSSPRTRARHYRVVTVRHRARESYSCWKERSVHLGSSHAGGS
jgi:hypothetical protein